MNSNEYKSDFRTALEIHRDRADSCRFCVDCEAWTDHVEEDDGSFTCLDCWERVAPDCDECDREAAAIVDNRPLCGKHALAEGYSE